MQFAKFSSAALVLALALGTPALAEEIGGSGEIGGVSGPTVAMSPMTSGIVEQLNVATRTLMVNNIALQVPANVEGFTELANGDDVTVRYEAQGAAFVVQELLPGELPD